MLSEVHTGHAPKMPCGARRANRQCLVARNGGALLRVVVGGGQGRVLKSAHVGFLSLGHFLLNQSIAGFNLQPTASREHFPLTGEGAQTTHFE